MLVGQHNTLVKTLKTMMSAENYMSTYAPGMMKLAKDSAWKQLTNFGIRLIKFNSVFHKTYTNLFLIIVDTIN